MKNLLFLFLLFIMISAAGNAQSAGRTYKNAFGIKLWDGAGVSFKTFLVPGKALELIGYFNRFGTRITGLYEIHGNVVGAPGLKWYAGPGAHISFYNYKGYNGDKSVTGIDGVLGVDYKINKTPLNLSIDWQPSLEFADERGIALKWGGFGIRYAF